MHAAGTRVQCHVQAQSQGRGTVVEGMAGHQAFELRARGPAQNFRIVPAEQGGAGREAFLGQQILAAPGLHQYVAEFRMQADGHVVRQGPGRGGPDDHIGAGRVSLRKDLAQSRVGQGKTHVDGGGSVVVVFHLGFGQSRMAGAAPIDGLLGADHAALFHKIGQFARRGGLIGGLHAHVGIVPVPEHAQSLEFLALHVDPFGRVVAAELAHHMRGQGLFLFLEFLLHLVLDGQAVAIPARHIAGGVPLHVAGFDHNVLENLVQRRAHVNVPVGVGRTVVQHIGAPAARSLDHGFAGVDPVPLLERFRLALGQIGLHGKGGLRKIQGFVVTMLAPALCPARPRQQRGGRKENRL